MYCEYDWGCGDMACGLQVFDANGNLDVDTSTGIAKYLGEFTTGFNAGSFSKSELKGGRIWLISKNLIIDSDLFTYTEEPKTPSKGTLTSYVLDFPAIKFDDKTGAISWTFVDTALVKIDTALSWTVIRKLRRISGTFIYGVF